MQFRVDNLWYIKLEIVYYITQTNHFHIPQEMLIKSSCRSIYLFITLYPLNLHTLFFHINFQFCFGTQIDRFGRWHWLKSLQTRWYFWSVFSCICTWHFLGCVVIFTFYFTIMFRVMILMKLKMQTIIFNIQT